MIRALSIASAVGVAGLLASVGLAEACRALGDRLHVGAFEAGPADETPASLAEREARASAFQGVATGAETAALACVLLTLGSLVALIPAVACRLLRPGRPALRRMAPARRDDLDGPGPLPREDVDMPPAVGVMEGEPWGS